MNFFEELGRGIQDALNFAPVLNNAADQLFGKRRRDDWADPEGAKRRQAEDDARIIPPPVAPADDAATIVKQDEAMRRQAKRQGRAATLLTGGQGLVDSQPKTARRMLIGE